MEEIDKDISLMDRGHQAYFLEGETIDRAGQK